MTLVEGEELQRLWALVSELSSQLSSNRELCQSLQAQADELKGQALHTGTGYTLRRFNLDISKEKFDSELERLNSQLVMENQGLTHENKQISLLLREYENTLESVMSKFRSFSHATQQHTLSLTSHYETLLSNDVHQVESSALHASTSFSNTLAHLGGLVRLALREVEGEALDSDEEDDEVKDSDPFEAEGYRVGSPSGIGPSSHTITSTKSTSGAKRAKTGYGSAPSRDPRWYGTGGYTGLQGDPEAERAEKALQARTEEERLRQENETLRELLRISGEITPEIAREFGIEIPAPPDPANWPKLGANAGKLSLGKARGSRKSIVDTTLPAKVNDAEIDGSTQADSQNDLENLTASDDTTTTIHDEPMDVDTPIHPSATLIVSNPEGEATLGENTSETADRMIPSHVVQGSGGPPQLSSDVEEEDATLKGGIVVTSQVSNSHVQSEEQEAKAAQKGNGLFEQNLGKPVVEPLLKKAKEAENVTLQETHNSAKESNIDEPIEVASSLEIDSKAEVRDRLLNEVQESLAESEDGETTITE